MAITGGMNHESLVAGQLRATVNDTLNDLLKEIARCFSAGGMHWMQMGDTVNEGRYFAVSLGIILSSSS